MKPGDVLAEVLDAAVVFHGAVMIDRARQAYFEAGTAWAGRTEVRSSRSDPASARLKPHHANVVHVGDNGGDRAGSFHLGGFCANVEQETLRSDKVDAVVGL